MSSPLTLAGYILTPPGHHFISDKLDSTEVTLLFHRHREDASMVTVVKTLKTQRWTLEAGTPVGTP